MKNTHLEHLEDEILNSGSAGGFNVITFLRQFSDMLTGKSTDLSITTKWDGAPAVVCGTEPVTGRFFVGTKSVFNKVNPKICFDDTDVDRFYKGELANKLKDCLQYLPQLNISGIVQGDLLYTEGDKISGVIGGNRVICFTPNTITYAVDSASRKGSAIRLSKMGIVFHTVYKGDSLQTAKVVPQKKAPKYPSTADVFVASANFVDARGATLFDQGDVYIFNSHINRANGSLKQCSKFLDLIQNQGQSTFMMHLLLKRFFNQRIRAGRGITNTKKVVTEFAVFYRETIEAEKAKKKTAAAQKKYEQMKTDGLMFIAKYQRELYHLISAYISIRTAKKMVINQLNKVGSIKTFVGRVPVSPEGYVVHNDKSMMKFVDDEFRVANITVDKAWATK
jgi:hypothetical protein